MERLPPTAESLLHDEECGGTGTTRPKDWRICNKLFSVGVLPSLGVFRSTMSEVSQVKKSAGLYVVPFCDQAARPLTVV